MSIAVSVIVRPSRVHRLLCLAWGLAQAGAAGAVGFAMPASFPGAPWLALLLTCTAVGMMHSAVRRPKTHRIDISGTGDLRVTVQQDVGGAGSAAAVSEADVPAVLLPGAVLWPMLAVLRYAPRDATADRGAGATARVLPVWRDSVDPDAWRGLAVALAVIGRRCGGEGFDKIR